MPQSENNNAENSRRWNSLPPLAVLFFEELETRILDNESEEKYRFQAFAPANNVLEAHSHRLKVHSYARSMPVVSETYTIYLK